MMGSKIKELRKLKKITQSELASKLGLESQTTISAIENGVNKPSSELLQKIADFFDVSADFLLGKEISDGGYLKLLFASKLKEKRTKENLSIYAISKEIDLDESHLVKVENEEYCDDWFFEYGVLGEYLGLGTYLGENLGTYAFSKEKLHSIIDQNSNRQSSFSDESSNVKYNESSFDRVNSLIYLPVLGTILAGQPILAEDNYEGYFPTDKQFILKDNEYFYLKIKGDSMDLEFKEGSLVLIQRQSCVDSGEIGVVLINGFDATVKKIFIKDNLITLMPQSSNLEYKPQIYDMSKEEIKILGKVILAVKKY